MRRAVACNIRAARLSSQLRDARTEQMTTALRHSTPCLANLAGAYLWIVDQHMRLIDHTPDVSHALGLNRDELTRRPGDNLNPVNDDNPAHRALRALQRERILAVIDSGRPSTQLHWEYLPAAGGMRHQIITIVKYSPTQALLIAHDLTEAAAHILDWLRIWPDHRADHYRPRCA